MDKWVRLDVCKKLVNLIVRVLNGVLPERQAVFPQTHILERIYDDLMRVYRIEVYCGRFDDIPYETLKTLKDKNFLRTLELSKKLLVYLGDEDRYYRQWLGLFLLVTHDVLKEHADCLTSEEACKQINGQWDYGLDERIFEQFFAGHRREAQEIVLCNYLHNLVTVNLNGGENCNEQPIDRS